MGRGERARADSVVEEDGTIANWLEGEELRIFGLEIAIRVEHSRRARGGRPIFVVSFILRTFSSVL